MLVPYILMLLTSTALISSDKEMTQETDVVNEAENQAASIEMYPYYSTSPEEKKFDSGPQPDPLDEILFPTGKNQWKAAERENNKPNAKPEAHQ